MSSSINPTATGSSIQKESSPHQTAEQFMNESSGQRTVGKRKGCVLIKALALALLLMSALSSNAGKLWVPVNRVEELNTEDTYVIVSQRYRSVMTSGQPKAHEWSDNMVLNSLVPASFTYSDKENKIISEMPVNAERIRLVEGPVYGSGRHRSYKLYSLSNKAYIGPAYEGTTYEGASTPYSVYTDDIRRITNTKGDAFDNLTNVVFIQRGDFIDIRCAYNAKVFDGGAYYGNVLSAVTSYNPTDSDLEGDGFYLIFSAILTANKSAFTGFVFNDQSLSRVSTSNTFGQDTANEGISGGRYWRVRLYHEVEVPHEFPIKIEGETINPESVQLVVSGSKLEIDIPNVHYTKAFISRHKHGESPDASGESVTGEFPAVLTLDDIGEYIYDIKLMTDNEESDIVNPVLTATVRVNVIAGSGLIFDFGKSDHGFTPGKQMSDDGHSFAAAGAEALDFFIPKGQDIRLHPEGGSLMMAAGSCARLNLYQPEVNIDKCPGKMIMKGEGLENITVRKGAADSNGIPTSEEIFTEETGTISLTDDGEQTLTWTNDSYERYLQIVCGTDTESVNPRAESVCVSQEAGVPEDKTYARIRSISVQIADRHMTGITGTVSEPCNPDTSSWNVDDAAGDSVYSDIQGRILSVGSITELSPGLYIERRQGRSRRILVR